MTYSFLAEKTYIKFVLYLPVHATPVLICGTFSYKLLAVQVQLYWLVFTY